jgi:hypothetical protein
MPSIPGAAQRDAGRGPDRRRHQRMPLALFGRYMLSSRQEYPCQTQNVSPGGLALVAPVRGLIGERVVVCLEHLGRLEGQIVRHTPLGLALAIGATMRRRDRLTTQITWLAERRSLGLSESRRHERVVPRHTPVVVRIPGEGEVTGRLIDVSVSGAAITLGNRPALGTPVTVGLTAATVVRHFDSGFAVEFAAPLSPDRFDESIVP